MTGSRSFGRNAESLGAIVDFTAKAFEAQGVDRGLLPPIDLALEELFTNMVKYSSSQADVRIEISKIEGGVQVTMFDEDVDFFDVSQARPVDVAEPLESRKPGGLGLHLVQRLVEGLEYEYLPEARRSRVTFRKTGA